MKLQKILILFFINICAKEFTENVVDIFNIDLKDIKILGKWENEIINIPTFNELEKNEDNINKLLFCAITDSVSRKNLKIASNKSRKDLAKEIFDIKMKNPSFTLEQSYGNRMINTVFSKASSFMNKVFIGFGIWFTMKLFSPIYEPIVTNWLRKFMFKNSIKPQEVSVLLKNVYGYNEIKKRLQLIIQNLKKQKESKQLKKIDGVLFYGDPGCGKTYVAQAIANEAEVPFFSIKVSDLINDKGAIEDRIKLLFNKISSYVMNNGTSAILFIDEIDLLMPARQQGKLLPEEKLILQDFLSLLDGQIPLEGILVIANTNFKKDIDIALLRKGRIGTHIEFTLPTIEDIYMLIESFAKDMNIKIDEKFDIDAFVNMLLGQNVSTIRSSLLLLKDFMIDKKYKLILNNDILQDYLKTFSLY